MIANAHISENSNSEDHRHRSKKAKECVYKTPVWLSVDNRTGTYALGYLAWLLAVLGQVETWSNCKPHILRINPRSCDQARWWKYPQRQIHWDWNTDNGSQHSVIVLVIALAYRRILSVIDLGDAFGSSGQPCWHLSTDNWLFQDDDGGPIIVPSRKSFQFTHISPQLTLRCTQTNSKNRVRDS